MDIFIFIVLGTVALIGIVAYFIIKKLRKEAWEGEVIDKRDETSSTGDYDSTNYYISIRLADGNQKRVAVPKKLFALLQPGDKVIKEAGKTYPRKV